MTEDEARFAAFVGEVEPRLRASLVAAYGPERGREAVAEALAWAWEHRSDLAAIAYPVPYLYRVGQSKTRPRLRPRLDTAVTTEGSPWVEPALPGASVVLYDSLMSTDAGDFLGAGSCLEWDISVTESSAPGDPAGDYEVWFYLARAVNGCPGPSGDGSLGDSWSGGERTGVACP